MSKSHRRRSVETSFICSAFPLLNEYCRKSTPHSTAPISKPPRSPTVSCIIKHSRIHLRPVDHVSCLPTSNKKSKPLDGPLAQESPYEQFAAEPAQLNRDKPSSIMQSWRCRIRELTPVVELARQPEPPDSRRHTRLNTRVIKPISWEAI
jgi:hypothetical protein